jgi:hypothetical protein
MKNNIDQILEFHLELALKKWKSNYKRKDLEDNSVFTDFHKIEGLYI